MGQPIKTYNGYDMFEVVSALQKSIRRGNEEEAVYWGVEMYISGFANYAWKRLQIMSMEDVGIANPYAALLVSNLKAIWTEMSAKEDKKNQERLPFVQAILYLTYCKKSRHVDWCQAFAFDEQLLNGFRQIPDYALDVHTRRGKMLGKTIEDFFTEGSFLENHANDPKEEWYKQQCHDRWTNREWCEHCNKVKEVWAEVTKGWRKKSASYESDPDTPKQPVQGELF